MDDYRLHSAKVFQMLAAMPPAMIERFKRFLDSPYFNTRPQLKSLGDILIDLAATQGAGEPLRSQAYELLFVPKQPFTYDDNKDKHLRKLLSDLKALADRFLEVEGFLSKESNGRGYLCEAYENLGLDRHFELEMQHALSGIPLEWSLPSELQVRHSVETLGYEHFVGRRNWKGVGTLPGASLVVYYYIERHIQLCEAILYKRIVEQPVEMPFADLGVPAIPPEVLAEYPIAQFYSMLYALLASDTGDFDALLVLAKRIAQRIPGTECRRLYNYLQNYCSGKLSQGQQSWRKVLLGVHMDRIALEGDLLPSELINMVTLAVQLKDAESAKHLYRVGIPKMVADVEGKFNRYLQAYLHYAEKDFAESRRLLNGLQSLDPGLEFYARVLEIKTWWESGDDDEHHFTLTLVQNLIRNLDRTGKLPVARRKLHLERFKAVRSILRAAGDVRELARIETRIKEGGGLIDQDYLLERIAEMIGSARKAR